jgi:hypothetical protein
MRSAISTAPRRTAERTFRASREADEVAEEHRDDLPLLQANRELDRVERGSAGAAEPKSLGVFLAASRAVDHRPSLGD